MLVLTRKVGEEIVIGDNIQIMVVAIKDKNVRIGITAPKEVVVDRQEVHETRLAMANKLRVDNLTLGVNDSDLEALFAPYGTVQSAQVVMDPDTGRSKGTGFVKMGTCDQTQAAISALNGKDSNGKVLTVNDARPPEDLDVILVAADASKSF